MQSGSRSCARGRRSSERVLKILLYCSIIAIQFWRSSQQGNMGDPYSSTTSRESSHAVRSNRSRRRLQEISAGYRRTQNRQWFAGQKQSTRYPTSIRGRCRLVMYVVQLALPAQARLQSLRNSNSVDLSTFVRVCALSACLVPCTCHSILATS